MEIPKAPEMGEPNTDFFPSLAWESGICRTYKGELKGTEIPKKPDRRVSQYRDPYRILIVREQESHN